MLCPRILVPTIRDLEWTAGFVEGEGSFAGSRGAVVSVFQVNREPLDRLKSLYGGKILPVAPRRETSSPAYQWYVTGPRARGLMFTLFPLLSWRRQAQIEAAIGGKR